MYFQLCCVLHTKAYLKLRHNTLWTTGCTYVNLANHWCLQLSESWCSWRILEQNVNKRNHGISWFLRYCTYYRLNKSYNRMCMKCIPGFSGSLKEKPLIEERSKKEKKKRQEKGRKTTERKNNQNRKGKLGKESQFFWWQGLFTKTHKNQRIWHAASTVTKKANVNMLQVLWHRPCNDKLEIWPGWKKRNVCVQVLRLPHSHQKS